MQRLLAALRVLFSRGGYVVVTGIRGGFDENAEENVECWVDIDHVYASVDSAYDAVYAGMFLRDDTDTHSAFLCGGGSMTMEGSNLRYYPYYSKEEGRAIDRPEG